MVAASGAAVRDLFQLRITCSMCASVAKERQEGVGGWLVRFFSLMTYGTPPGLSTYNFGQFMILIRP